MLKTILYFYLLNVKSKKLMVNFKTWFTNEENLNINLSAKDIIFGVLEKKNFFSTSA